MRMRHKKWAEPELQSAAFFVPAPRDLRGRWREAFARPEQPLALELGCGKGLFISRAAARHPQVNFVAIDQISNVLGSCKRAVDEQFSLLEGEGRPPDNILITAFNAERITELLAPEDRVDRLYINFCNPWPKAKHRKHRLTHPRQLEQYRTFLAPGAQLHFKTDDAGLFEDTVGYLEQAGFRLASLTRDLPRGDLAYETEHERLFRDQGRPIRFLTAEAD